MQHQKGRTAGVAAKLLRRNGSKSTTPSSDLTLKLPRSEYPESETEAAADENPGFRQVVILPSACHQFTIIVQTRVQRVSGALGATTVVWESSLGIKEFHRDGADPSSVGSICD